MLPVRSAIAAAGLALAATTASAGMLTTDSVFGAGDTTVTFDEVPVPGGSAVTTQFGAYGVSFGASGPSPVDWRSSGNPATWSSNPNFSGTYLDSFTGGGQFTSPSDVWSIFFAAPVTKAGAFWEFNPSVPAASFAAYLGGTLVDSFSYDNPDCCSSTQFLGFQGVTFDSIRVSNIASNDFIMDTLKYGGSVSPVPEPGTYAMLALGIGLLAFYGRRARKEQAAGALRAA